MSEPKPSDAQREFAEGLLQECTEVRYLDTGVYLDSTKAAQRIQERDSALLQPFRELAKELDSIRNDESNNDDMMPGASAIDALNFVIPRLRALLAAAEGKEP